MGKRVYNEGVILCFMEYYFGRQEGIMMKISQRALSLTTSPIRRLGPYAVEAEKAGKKIYHLNIGQPDIETPPQFMEAIRSFNKKTVAYGPSQGDMHLIHQIQKYYKEWGMEYSEKNIFITSGGSEALELAALTLCDPGTKSWCLNLSMPTIIPLPRLPAPMSERFLPALKRDIVCRTRKRWKSTLPTRPVSFF